MWPAMVAVMLPVRKHNSGFGHALTPKVSTLIVDHYACNQLAQFTQPQHRARNSRAEQPIAPAQAHRRKRSLQDLRRRSGNRELGALL